MCLSSQVPLHHHHLALPVNCHHQENGLSPGSLLDFASNQCIHLHIHLQVWSWFILLMLIYLMFILHYYYNWKVHRRCWVYSQPLCSPRLDSDLHLSGHLFVHSYLHCLHHHSCQILQTQKNTPEKSHPAQQKKEHLCQRHHLLNSKQRYWSYRRLSHQRTINSR